MKLFKVMKDGGPLSHVWGFWLIEWKRLFSIALLRFEDGSREAYHTHAFNAWSWVLWGRLWEQSIIKPEYGPVDTYSFRKYTPSFWPIYTPRDTMHRVVSRGRTWVLTFRGPWRDTWWEYIPAEDAYFKLTHGREVLEITRTMP